MTDALGLTPRILDPEALQQRTPHCDLMVVAAGYEERALAFFKANWSPRVANLIVVEYGPSLPQNVASLALVRYHIASVSRDYPVHTVLFDCKDGLKFTQLLEHTARSIGIHELGNIWLDVSGLPFLGVAEVLRVLRKLYPVATLEIFYTEALEYYPRKVEYDQFSGLEETPHSDPLEHLPAALTTEMSDTLIPDSFSGFMLGRYPTCLFLFAGYEKHRSIGVIETVNPALLVVVYGSPHRSTIGWRLEMSRKLHATLLTEREQAQEVCSTLDVAANLALLTEYYEMVYDDHNICISPNCSKMQVVASYLLWERFRDVQLAFPMPVSYLPDRSSLGSGNTFSLILPSTQTRRAFFSRGRTKTTGLSPTA